MSRGSIRMLSYSRHVSVFLNCENSTRVRSEFWEETDFKREDFYFFCLKHFQHFFGDNLIIALRSWGSSRYCDYWRHFSLNGPETTSFDSLVLRHQRFELPHDHRFLCFVRTSQDLKISHSHRLCRLCERDKLFERRRHPLWWCDSARTPRLRSKVELCSSAPKKCFGQTNRGAAWKQNREAKSNCRKDCSCSFSAKIRVFNQLHKSINTHFVELPDENQRDDKSKNRYC